MSPRLVPGVLSLLLSWPCAALAQDLPPPPPLLDDSDAAMREILEPQVTIIRRDGEMIEEYRFQGRLYMVRVVPDQGPPYYLIDTDGSGDLETRMDELDPRMMIPAWVLFRW